MIACWEIFYYLERTAAPAAQNIPAHHSEQSGLVCLQYCLKYAVVQTFGLKATSLYIWPGVVFAWVWEERMFDWKKPAQHLALPTCRPVKLTVGCFACKAFAPSLNCIPHSQSMWCIVKAGHIIRVCVVRREASSK